MAKVKKVEPEKESLASNEPQLVLVDKVYLNKRLNDLVNSNQEVFNEYWYIKNVLAQKPTEPKE